MPIPPNIYAHTAEHEYRHEPARTVYVVQRGSSHRAGQLLRAIVANTEQRSPPTTSQSKPQMTHYRREFAPPTSGGPRRSAIAQPTTNTGSPEQQCSLLRCARRPSIMSA